MQCYTIDLGNLSWRLSTVYGITEGNVLFFVLLSCCFSILGFLLGLPHELTETSTWPPCFVNIWHSVSGNTVDLGGSGNGNKVPSRYCYWPFSTPRYQDLYAWRVPFSQMEIFICQNVYVILDINCGNTGKHFQYAWNFIFQIWQDQMKQILVSYLSILMVWCSCGMLFEHKFIPTFIEKPVCFLV